MKIPIKDFNIEPVLCPMGGHNCAPCKHLKANNVHNCPISSSKEDFGFVECTYIETFQKQLREVTQK